MTDHTLVIDSNKFLYELLDTIRETCTKRDRCEGCAFAGSYTTTNTGLRYYCAIDEEPRKWQTGIVGENLEKLAESEEKI